MEAYDDRPVSAYDNLQGTAGRAMMHTSTPKLKVPGSSVAMSTTLKPTAPASSNGGAKTRLVYDARNDGDVADAYADGVQLKSPHYTELSFPFDGSNTAATHQHFNNNHNRINANNHTSSNNNTNQPQQSLQTSDDVVYYATPFKAATKPAPTTTPAAQLPQTATATPTSSSALALTLTSASPSPSPSLINAQRQQQQATYASPVRLALQKLQTQQQQQHERPLSQHSQSEANEASQNIAAVKAALNDAKSKFFGINDNQPHQQMPIVQTTTTTTPTPSQNPANPTTANAIKPQPKYQNIPENSAVYRNQKQQEPPALPPKPIKSHAPAVDSTSPPPAPSPESIAPAATIINMPLGRGSTTPEPLPGMSARTSPDYQHQHSPSPQPSKILPYSTYQQLPLNDVDSPTPSQAVYMTTTVPQNLKGSKISGRHTPTRNSLRHSRMLVVNNKTYRELQQPNPMNFVYPNLSRWLLILQLIVGILLGCLAIWIFFLTPSTPIQDNPYWSGLALILTGFIGLVLIRYERIKRHKVREKCFLFLRADSYLLSLLAIVLCCAALTCAAIHHYRITASDTHCESTNPLLEYGSCTCTFNAMTTVRPMNTTATKGAGAAALANQIDDNELYDRSYKVEYRDLTCQEVNCEWIYILVLSIILNSFGLIISVFYIIMLACYRRSSKALYATVHTSTF